MDAFFGTDGIRGPYGVAPITPSFAYRLARVLAHIYLPHSSSKTLVTAWDGRKSSLALHHGLSQGWQKAGGEVLDLGLAPTPACAAVVSDEKKALLGVMISASHNPYSHNGFKIFAADGSKISTEEQNRITQTLHSFESLEQEYTPEPSPYTLRWCDQGRLKRYGEKLVKVWRSCLTLKEHQSPLQEGFCGVVDCAHGAMSWVAEWVLEAAAYELGASLCFIHQSPDGENINRDVGSMGTEALRREVIQQGVDFGIAFDGDGDRLLLLDGSGELVEGSQLLGLWALDLAATHQLAQNTVASTIMVSGGLEETLRKAGIKLIRTQVGDRHIAEVVKTGGLSLAGEPSGHYIMPAYGPTGDGLAAALEVLSYMFRGKTKDQEFSLKTAADVVMLWPEYGRSFNVKEKVPLEHFPKLLELVGEVERSLLRTGGGRVVLRYSGTESKLRLWCEGRDPDQVQSGGEKLREEIIKTFSL